MQYKGAFFLESIETLLDWSESARKLETACCYRPDYAVNRNCFKHNCGCDIKEAKRVIVRVTV